MIENISTTEVVFRCNPGFVLAGRMSATCVSPDGISVVGTWTPDPADLVCNGKNYKYVLRTYMEHEICCCICYDGLYFLLMPVGIL